MRSALFALLLASATALPAAEARFAAPSPFPADPTVIAFAVVPQLPRLLEHLHAAGGNACGAGALADGVSVLLGDPGFARIDTAQPLVAIAFAPADGASDLAAWVPTVDPAPYLNAARRWKVPAASEGKLVVIANSDAALARARGAPKTYAAIAQAAVADDVRLRCAGERAWLAYGETVRDQAWLTAARLTALKRPAGAPDFAPGMRLAIAALLAVAQDVQDLQIDLSAAPEGVSATVSLTAQPGSQLASALVQPPHDLSAAGIIGTGADLTRVVGAIDPRATGGFVSHLLRRIAAEQRVAIPDAIYAAFDAIAADANGAFALRTAKDAGGTVRFSSVTGVASAAAGEALVERVSAAIADGGALTEAFARLGIPLRSSVTRDARRTHDLPVRRIAMAIDESAVPVEQRTALLAFIHDTEVACANGRIVCAQDPGELDALVERALAPPPEPPPAEPTPMDDIAISCDVVGVLQASLDLAATANPDSGVAALRDAVAAVPAGQPMTARGLFERGAAEWRLKLPLQPLSKAIDAASRALAAATPRQ